jgi:hypothetical protein
MLFATAPQGLSRPGSGLPDPTIIRGRPVRAVAWRTQP